MKKIVQVCCVILVAAAMNQAQAQQIGQDSISWVVSSFKDLNADGAITTAESEFRTYASSVDWLQESGGQIYTYQITLIDGQWNDLAQDGELTLHVSWHALTGEFHLKRENGVLSISMDFDKAGSNIMSLLFSVNSVTKI